jgi:hypothetical protein
MVGSFLFYFLFLSFICMVFTFIMLRELKVNTHKANWPFISYWSILIKKVFKSMLQTNYNKITLSGQKMQLCISVMKTTSKKINVTILPMVIFNKNIMGDLSFMLFHISDIFPKDICSFNFLCLCIHLFIYSFPSQPFYFENVNPM